MRARPAPSPSPSAGAPVHERLMAVAKELFAAEGYENTTTAAIARGAGTSESQLIKHFGSKEGLLEAVFDAGWAQLEPAMRRIHEQGASALARLQALAEVMTSALEQDTRLRTLMLLEGRRIRRHGRDVVLTGGYRRFVAVIDATLQELANAGQLRAGIDVQAARSAFVGAGEGLMRDQLLAEISAYPAAYDSVEVRKAMGLVFSAFLTPAAVQALIEGTHTS